METKTPLYTTTQIGLKKRKTMIQLSINLALVAVIVCLVTILVFGKIIPVAKRLVSS